MFCLIWLLFSADWSRHPVSGTLASSGLCTINVTPTNQSTSLPLSEGMLGSSTWFWVYNHKPMCKQQLQYPWQITNNNCSSARGQETNLAEICFMFRSLGKIVELTHKKCQDWFISNALIVTETSLPGCSLVFNHFHVFLLVLWSPKVLIAFSWCLASFKPFTNLGLIQCLLHKLFFFF